MDLNALRDAFRSQFSGEPEIVTIAPGRINLIGEHTDYNEGFVFPAAIDRSLHVAAQRTEGPSVVHSVQMGPASQFDAMSIEPGQIGDWAQYAAGMAWVLRDRGEIPNVKAIVHSDVPIGSGVSSSAALELAFGVLYNHLAGLGIGNKELALLGQKDENLFVGVNSGIMDQMACAMGREGKAMFLDTRTLDIEYAPVPAQLAIVLLDTKTPRALTSSAYNQRRSQCERAARALGVKALRDAGEQDLQQLAGKVDEVVYRRARHVITENARCVAFLRALHADEIDTMGELMNASHISLRDDYEVSSLELNLMAEAAWNAPGCVGARMTGAGFGGACVALVERNQIDAFSESVNLAYNTASGINGEVVSCRPVEGARVLWHA
jgi:galactokinase